MMATKNNQKCTYDKKKTKLNSVFSEQISEEDSGCRVEHHDQNSVETPESQHILYTLVLIQIVHISILSRQEHNTVCSYLSGVVDVVSFEHIIATDHCSGLPLSHKTLQLEVAPSQPPNSLSLSLLLLPRKSTVPNAITKVSQQNDG